MELLQVQKDLQVSEMPAKEEESPEKSEKTNYYSG